MRAFSRSSSSLKILSSRAMLLLSNNSVSSELLTFLDIAASDAGIDVPPPAILLPRESLDVCGNALVRMLDLGVIEMVSENLWNTGESARIYTIKDGTQAHSSAIPTSTTS